MSSLRIDDTRLRVHFVPEMTQQRTALHNAVNSTSSPARTVSQFVAEMVDGILRRPASPDAHEWSASRRRLERRRRYVGVYLTDGRSHDTAGTVVGIEKAVAELGPMSPRGRDRVDLVAVGIGPEVSETQLITVARGRHSRLLTVYTGHDRQNISTLRDLSDSLVSLLCTTSHLRLR